MADHRADTRAVSRRRPVDATGASAASAGGLHRANESRRTHSGHRKTLFRGIPSAPTLVGVSALALAAVGALSASSPAAGSAQLTAGHVGGSTTGHASAFSGTSDVASASVLADRREQAVSRDSQRDALRDAADEKLQAVAEKQAKERNAALAQLAASAEKQAGLIARNSWQLPVTRGAYHLTSRFGECSGLWSHCHTGLDFAAPSGTPIHAIAGGTISETASAGAYGNRTIETLADGTELWYCHQTSFSVRPGQKVRAGQLIGSVGATGNTTGPHVHVEVRPGAGDPVDPDAAMRAHGLKP